MLIITRVIIQDTHIYEVHRMYFGEIKKRISGYHDWTLLYLEYLMDVK